MEVHGFRAEQIKALLIDLDGTLHFKGAAIEGANAALAQLRCSNLALRFMTNADSQTNSVLQAQMQALGLDIASTELFTPASALRQLLQNAPGKRCYLLLSPALAAEFAPYASSGPETVDYVVVGDCRETLSYTALNTAFRHLMNGAELIALQKGRYFVRADGYYLDTGAFVQLLEYGASTSARVLGKPSAAFFQLALDQLGCRADEVAVVGDDVTTDLLGARQIGATAVLVRTGKFSPAALAMQSLQPDLLLDSIADLPPLFAER